MTASNVETGPAPGGIGRGWVLAPVVMVAVALVAILGIAAVTRSTPSPAPAAVAMAMPSAAGTVDVTTLAPDVAGQYRYVAAHAAEFAQVPCFCGCEQSFGHRNLADCFLRADGAGFDSHAAGCGVCLGEATVTHDLLDNGLPPSSAADAVTRQYGGTVPTTPDATVPPTTEASS